MLIVIRVYLLVSLSSPVIRGRKHISIHFDFEKMVLECMVSNFFDLLKILLILFLTILIIVCFVLFLLLCAKYLQMWMCHVPKSSRKSQIAVLPILHSAGTSTVTLDYSKLVEFYRRFLRRFRRNVGFFDMIL